MIDQQKDIFREEAAELLTELESALLSLEENPGDGEKIAQVFRAMHTIKGSGAMFGFDELAAFTHEVETVYDRIRNGDIPVTRELINLSLACRDHIRDLLEESGSESADRVMGEDLVRQLRSLLPAEAKTETRKKGMGAMRRPEEDSAPRATYRLRIRLPRDIVLRGTRPDTLLRELSELGSCRVVAQTESIPLLEEMDPSGCYTHWDVVLTTDRGENAIRDVFIFVEDEAEVNLQVIDDGNSRFEGDRDYKRIGEILVERGDLSREDLETFLSAQQKKSLGEMLLSAGKVHPDRLEAALQEQEQVRELRRQQQQTQDSTSSSIRVPAERLDFLVDMVGELVTVQARLSQLAALRGDAEILEIAEAVERLTAELRDSSLTLRMLPIGSTFSKFKRLVRDLSLELGKEIELQTEGGDTELDKTVIERLNDPLVHLIRNCLDHGIEHPEIRLAAGKPGTGRILLTAEHSGDSVVIRIRDDGRGLDREAILAKAVEKGVVTPETRLSDPEIFDLIFAPGFSTAKSVSSVSGRGVGMDVVKRAIDSLRGTISLESRPGAGTTVSLRIPLTLAIVESLLVQLGEDSFVLPLSAVEECVELTREDVTRSHGRNLINVRGHLIPYIPLRQHFGVPGGPPGIQQVVITRVHGHQVGFVVDRVVGEHQTVIKSLGRMYREVRGLSGATILGDGSVALILDLPQLMQQAEISETSTVSAQMH